MFLDGIFFAWLIIDYTSFALLWMINSARCDDNHLLFIWFLIVVCRFWFCNTTSLPIRRIRITRSPWHDRSSHRVTVRALTSVCSLAHVEHQVFTRQIHVNVALLPDFVRPESAADPVRALSIPLHITVCLCVERQIVTCLFRAWQVRRHLLSETHWCFRT